MQTGSPPRLTPAFWGWALIDIIGVLVLAVGAAYLMEDRASILPGFRPTRCRPGSASAAASSPSSSPP